ncbi:MAG: hypothetical protein ACOCRZ_04580 [Halothermotrichaceae bacterium]
MKYKDHGFNLKYMFIYPFLTMVFISLLTIAVIDTILNFYPDITLSFWTYLIIFLFYIEAIFSSQVKSKINSSLLLLLVEFAGFSGCYYLLNSDIYIFIFGAVLVTAFLGWFNIFSITSLFNRFYMEKNSVKKCRESDKDMQIESLIKGFTYPAIIKEIISMFFYSNFILALIFLIRRGLSVRLSVLTGLIIGLDFLVISLCYYEKLHLDWFIEGTDILSSVKRYWVKGVIVLVAALIIFAAVMPANYGFVNYKDIGNWWMSFMDGDRTSSVENIGSSSSGIRETQAEVEKVDREASVFLSVVFLIGEILLVLIPIAAIIVFIIYLIKSWRTVPEFFRRFIISLKNVIKFLFSSIKSLKKNTLKSWKSSYQKKKEQKEKEKNMAKDIKSRKLSANFKNLIIQIYQSMLKLISVKYNMKKKGYQTPYEYSEEINKINKKNQEEVNYITSLYVELIYSDHSLKDSLITELKQVWKKIKKSL